MAEPPIAQDEQAARIAQLEEEVSRLAEENARLRKLLTRRTQRGTALARISSRIHSTPDLPVILQVVAEEIGIILDASYCCIDLEIELPSLPSTFAYCASGAAPEEKPSAAPSRSGDRSLKEEGFLLMPILLRHELLGTIGVWRDNGVKWLPGEIELVSLTAGGLAMLLANARLLLENERRAREIDQLRAVAQIIIEESDAYRLAERLAEQASALVGAEQAMVGLVTGGVVVADRIHRRGRWEPVDLHFQPGEGVAGWVFVHGRPYLSQDTAADPQVSPEFIHRFSCRAVLAVPIVSRHQRVLGVIELHSSSSGAFDEGDVDHAQTIAHQAAIALERAQLFDEMQQRAGALETLLSFSAELNEQLNLETLVRRLVEHAAGLVGASAGLGGLVESSGIRSRGYWNTGRWLDFGKEWDTEESLAGWVVTNKRPYLTNDYRREERADAELAATFDVRSALCVPILDANDQALGFFEIHNKVDVQQPFSWADAGMLESLANSAAVAIRNSLLFEKLEAQRSQLRALSAQLVTSLEEERRHIARELHDEAGQALIGIKLNLQVLARQIPAGLPELREETDHLRRQVNEATRKLQVISRGLRPPALDELGLEPALHRLVADFEESAGVVVELKTSTLVRRLPQAVEIACYRVVQEALTNVARHAEASRVWIALAVQAQEVALEIKDDGRGFETDRKRRQGLGLLGMKERVTMLDGELFIDSAPGAGTRIQMRIPLDVQEYTGG